MEIIMMRQYIEDNFLLVALIYNVETFKAGLIKDPLFAF